MANITKLFDNLKKEIPYVLCVVVALLALGCVSDHNINADGGLMNTKVHHQIPTLDEAINSPQDLWGDDAIAEETGPNYEFFETLLPPLRYVNTAFREYPIVLSAPGNTHKARLISTASANWDSVERDSDTDDPGFHYEPVDVVLAGESWHSLGSDVVVTIKPGCVVSCEPLSGIEVYQPGAKLIAVGNPDNAITFTTTYATSDRMMVPSPSSDFVYLYFARALDLSADASQLEYCSFTGGVYPCIEELGDECSYIKNCVFRNSSTGVRIVEGKTTIENCLFIDVEKGVIAGIDLAETQKADLLLKNNTFIGCATSVSHWSLAESEIALHNTCFVNNELVYSSPCGNEILDVRSCAFWNNEDDGIEDLPEECEVSPMFVHHARGGALADASAFAPDGFYLAQEAGDASRRPLYLADLATSDGIVPEVSWSGLMRISACLAPGVSTNIPKGEYFNGVYSDLGGTQTNNGWPILVNIQGQGVTWDHLNKITLNFLNGSSMDVHLPDLTFSPDYDTTYKLMIAEDGSTYFARSDHGKGGYVTQTSLYAMNYDPAGLAQSAYDARLEVATGTDKEKKLAARSPAVDAGVEDGYDYDTTSTRKAKVDLGKPDLGFHYFRRIADDDPIDNQEIVLAFTPPKETTLKTIKYVARAMQAGREAGEAEILHDPSKAVMIAPVRFNPPLQPGKYEIRLYTVSENANGRVLSPEYDSVNILVEPNSFTNEEMLVTAEGVTQTGGDASDKVYLKVEGEKNVIYFNDSGEVADKLDKIRLKVAVPESKNPWKVEFGNREGVEIQGTPEPKEWRHFEDYEVFATPTQTVTPTPTNP